MDYGFRNIRVPHALKLAIFDKLIKSSSSIFCFPAKLVARLDVGTQAKEALGLCFDFKILHFLLLFSDNLLHSVAPIQDIGFNLLPVPFCNINILLHTCSFCNQRPVFLLELVNNFLVEDYISNMTFNLVENTFGSLGTDIGSSTSTNWFHFYFIFLLWGYR
ncbi:hypothetical protein V6Z11_D11G300500 [Gossypium hirsutum]